MVQIAQEDHEDLYEKYGDNWIVHDRLEGCLRMYRVRDRVLNPTIACMEDHLFDYSHLLEADDGRKVYLILEHVQTWALPEQPTEEEVIAITNAVEALCGVS